MKILTEVQKEKIREELSDDLVKNIQIMAPYLDSTAQNRVFGLMQGVLMGLENNEKKAG